MENKKSIGLPSGPNEFLKEITQHISVEGYKRYSDDVNNPYNIIESGNITMEDVDFPVMGTDNLGNSQMMMPGKNYQFPGDQVFEVPMAQGGIEVPKRKGVRLNYDAEGNVIGESTHIMKAEIVDGKWYGFPTLFQNDDNTWDNTFELLINENEKNWMPAFQEAKRRGELIEFGEDGESAIKFGEGSWKPKAQAGTEVEEKSLWGLVKEMSKIPGAKISNLLGVLGIPANLIAEATESFTGRGDGEFNFMDAMPSYARPGSDDEIFAFTNQNGTPVKNVAGLEDAEGNPLVENPVGAFITNLATDPSTYVGAGVAKNIVQKSTKAIPAMVKSIKKAGRDQLRKIPRTVKTPIAGTDMVMTTNSKIGQLVDKTGIPNLFWKKGFNMGADDTGKTFVASASNKSGDIIDLSKYTDEAGDFFTFDNAFVKNPRVAGKSLKEMEKSIPKHGVIKQNPLDGSLSEDSFTMMLQRIKNPKKFKDVTNYNENIFLNRSGKNRIVKPGATNQALVDQNLFDASEVAALNTKYGKIFDKLKDKGLLNDEFRGFGTREIKIPGLANKTYQVGVPNIGVQKLYQPGGEYKVQRGDTFYGIANKNNVSWNDLKKANPNVNIESLGLNQNIIIPKSIDSSSNMQKSEQSKNSNILNYDTLSNYLVETRGGTIDTWGQLADTVAFHEAGSEQRGNPKARQISQRADGTFYDGPGRGVFQFENESFETAIKRYKNIASSQGFSLKENIVNATSADQLSLEDQYAIFLANLIESKAKLSDFADGNLSSLDVWLSGHKNVEAKGNRDSFLESENAAKKEGIKNGYKTFQEGGGVNHTVAEGDNLSRIARKYNTSVDDIVRLNDISDPNQISINQELIIPESTKPANITNSYNVRPGDTLGRIAKTYNTTAKNLAKYNDIEDMNMIKVNQQIAIPDNIRKLVDEPVPTWNPVDSYLEQTNETNALSDEKIIIQSQMLNNPNQSYVIIDKTTNQLKVLNGEDEALSFEVLTGKNSGDSQTVTKMNDINGDGRINDKDKVNGNWQTNWDRSNLSTGAGRFEISASSPTSTNQYQNAPSWNLINDNGIEVATAIHGTTNYRKQFFGDDNVQNNRASNGCINGQCTDLDALYDLDLPIGTPIFILPEDKGNNFILQDGKAIFKASNKNRQNALTYINSLGEEESGQGINYTSKSLSYKPIKAKFDKEKFKEDIFTAFDFNDEEELENSTLPFIQALQDNKKAIMLKAQIPGDVYNQIAKMAFGIYGTESNFGDTHSAVGNLGRAANKYLDRQGSSSPDIVSKYNTYNVQGERNSVGYTQIRWSQLNDKEKSALKSFDITSNKDFLDPKKSAIATATILGIRYNEQLTADQKKNVWKNLPGKWNNRGNYTKRVEKNSAYLDFEQLGVLNKGGEIENHIMYKNYINGIYEGSKMQSKAEKVYDKLNRLHYRDAKAKQMTPANYVLSEIIG